MATADYSLITTSKGEYCTITEGKKTFQAAFMNRTVSSADFGTLSVVMTDLELGHE